MNSLKIYTQTQTHLKILFLFPVLVLGGPKLEPTNKFLVVSILLF